jgi:hypothetical protein
MKEFLTTVAAVVVGFIVYKLAKSFVPQIP